MLRLCGKGSDSSNGDDCESDPLCSARANFAVGQGETVGPPCDGSFSRPLLGTDWTGLDWTGLDWTGLDYTGICMLLVYSDGTVQSSRSPTGS